MPSTAYTTIGENLEFGCDGAALQIAGQAQTIGLIQNCKMSNSSKKAEGKNSRGKTVTITVYDGGGELSANLLLKVGATTPNIGDTLTIGGRTCLIEKVDVAWENEKHKSLDISGSWAEGVDSSQVNATPEPAATGS